MRNKAESFYKNMACKRMKKIISSGTYSRRDLEEIAVLKVLAETIKFSEAGKEREFVKEVSDIIFKYCKFLSVEEIVSIYL